MKKLIVILICLILSVSVAYAETGLVFISGPIMPNQQLKLVSGEKVDYPGTLERLVWDIGNVRWQSSLRGEKLTDLLVIISSPGGDLRETLAIYNYLVLLKKWKIKVHTIASSICMSGGVAILQAGDTRSAMEYTKFMTHSSAWYFKDEAYLTRSEMEEALSHHTIDNDEFVNLHAKRIGMEKARLTKYFTSKPYFFDTTTAYQIGFIDRIIGDVVDRKPKSINQRNYEKIETLIKEEQDEKKNKK